MQQNTYIMNKLELEEGSWNSLYLRVLPADLVVDGMLVNNEETLKVLIEDKLKIGKVERIDFSERNNHKGNVTRSAYIHFFMWDNLSGKTCRDMIETNGSTRINGYINSLGEFVPFMGQWHNGVGFNRFIELKKNINPISKTTNEEMNKEQLISKCNQYEVRVQELYKKVNDFIDGERLSLIKMVETKNLLNKMFNNKEEDSNKMEIDNNDKIMTLEELETAMEVEI